MCGVVLVESVDTANSLCIDCLFINCHSTVGKHALDASIDNARPNGQRSKHRIKQRWS